MESDSYNQQLLDDLFLEILDIEKGNAKVIQHLMKVHSFARSIAIGERMDTESVITIEAAAYLHNIGVRPAEEKYGKSDGEIQEQEGPIIAQFVLSELGFDNYIIERVCYLIGHHRTFDVIEEEDLQILVESELLVGLYEDDANESELLKSYKTLFVTDTGKKIFKLVFNISEED